MVYVSYIRIGNNIYIFDIEVLLLVDHKCVMVMVNITKIQMYF